jgi:thioredoxin reductase
MKPDSVHVAIVGTGPYGLEAAAWARARGYRVTVLERQDGIGGDWLRWGNAWSKLQSHRDGYLFSGPVDVPGEAELPAYPSREQMLAYFRAYADAAGITEHIHFGCTVTGRSAVQGGKVAVSWTDRAGNEHSLEATHVFAAPGRVNQRREPRFAGQDAFTGRVAWGSGCDLDGFDFTGKAVVVVGHGSFAVENARHALEAGAASVILLARHDQVVMSRAAGYFVERHVDRRMPATAVLETLRAPYRLVGREGAALDELFFAPSHAMFPTSDFYFLARVSGKLCVVIGEVARLGATAVETVAGASIPADVVIKCVGFAQDKRFDRAMRADLHKGGRCSVFHHSNVTMRMSRTSPFTGGAGGFRHSSPCYAFMASVECLAGSELAARTAALRTRVAERSRTRQSLCQFLGEQQREWAGYCELLGVRTAYPYTLQDMRAWEALLGGSAPAAARAGPSEPAPPQPEKARAREGGGAPAAAAAPSTHDHVPAVGRQPSKAKLMALRSAAMAEEAAAAGASSEADDADIALLNDDAFTLLMSRLEMKDVVAARCTSHAMARKSDAVLHDPEYKARQLRSRGKNVAWRVAAVESGQQAGSDSSAGQRGWMHSLVLAGASSSEAAPVPALARLREPEPQSHPHQGGGRSLVVGGMSALDNAGQNYRPPYQPRTFFGARRRMF